jgi:aspartyl-tRNA(Asn)/glutamyl-tRNA(Gln) amidotransferase subunit C
MALSEAEVRHLARLARVSVSDEEVARLQAQLSTILEHFELLNAIDTEGVPPTAQSFDLSNVEREDASRPSPPREELLANAPKTDGPYVRVRAVLE